MSVVVFELVHFSVIQVICGALLFAYVLSLMHHLWTESYLKRHRVLSFDDLKKRTGSESAVQNHIAKIKTPVYYDRHELPWADKVERDSKEIRIIRTFRKDSQS